MRCCGVHAGGLWRAAPTSAAAAIMLLSLACVSRTLGAEAPSADTPKVGEPLSHLRSIHANVKLVDFSPDGALLAVSVYSANAVYLYQTSDWTLTRIVHGRQRSCCRMYALSFSPGGRLLAAVGMDDTLRVFDVATGEESLKPAFTKRVVGAVFSPDGDAMATAGDDGVVLWDAHTGERLRVLAVDKGFDALAYSPDGRMLAGGGNSLKIWDGADGRELLTLQVKTPATSLSFSPDGRVLAESEEREVNLWDISTGELQKSFADPDSSGAKTSAWAARALMGPAWLILGAAADQAAITPQPVVFVPTTKSLAMVRDPRTGGRRTHDVLVYDANKGAAHLLNLGFVVSLSFSNDGKLVAAATDGGVKVWDAATGEQRQ